MKTINKRYLSLRILSAVLFCSTISATAASDMDSILQQVKSGVRSDIQHINQTVDESKKSLADLEKSRAIAAKSLQETELKNTALEDELLALQAQLEQARKKLADSKAAVQGVSDVVEDHENLLSNNLSRFSTYSLVSSDSQKTSEDITGKIQQIWLTITEQIVLSGKIQTATQQVILKPDGSPETTDVTHIGPFTAFSKEGWLKYLPTQRQWMVLDQQPELTPSLDQPLIDPSLGVLLEQAGKPTPLMGSLAPAGIVGVIIGIVALAGCGIALYRLAILLREKRAFASAMADENLSGPDSALTRVLNTVPSQEKDVDAYLDAAILKELPQLQRGIGTIAVLAAIAPLLGLLGTVGGMIETFTVLTEYGNANQDLLSEGIAEALLTTKLGLITAIPLLLLHCWLKATSGQLIEVLEQQAAGLLVTLKSAQEA